MLFAKIDMSSLPGNIFTVTKCEVFRARYYRNMGCDDDTSHMGWANYYPATKFNGCVQANQPYADKYGFLWSGVVSTLHKPELHDVMLSS